MHPNESAPVKNKIKLCILGVPVHKVGIKLMEDKYVCIIIVVINWV